jgi:tetratricopeptide (TPR) repeat protein
VDRTGTFRGRLRSGLQNAGGAQQVAVATVLYNMASLYARQNKLRETENLLRRSLAIWEATLPRFHASVARAIHDLASLYVIEHKYAKAQPLLERLLAIREEVSGSNDPKLEPALQALAEVYIAQRNYKAAEPLYQHMLSIQERAGGPRNTEYVANLTKYAFLLRKLNRKAESAALSAQARAPSSVVSADLPPASSDRSGPESKKDRLSPVTRSRLLANNEWVAGLGK